MDNDSAHPLRQDRTAVVLGALISLVGLGLFVGGLRVLFSPPLPQPFGFRGPALLWLLGLPPGRRGVAELVVLGIVVSVGLVAGGVSVILRSPWGMRVAVVSMALEIVSSLRQAALCVLFALGTPEITWNPPPGSGASRLSLLQARAVCTWSATFLLATSFAWLWLLVWVRRRLGRTSGLAQRKTA